MKVIFRADDGTEFEDSERAMKYEALKRDKVQVRKIQELKLIPLSELNKIFEIGDVMSLCFYIKDEDGDIDEDGWYETNSLDSAGHLECTDYEHGLLEWDDTEQAYFRTVYGRSWKVDILGISKVSYY